MTSEQGRVAIVTGAGTGIGRAIAHALCEVGVRCLIVGRRREQLDETVAGAPGPGDISALAADITDAGDRARIVAAATLDRFGRIVNVASVYGSLTLNPELYDSFPHDDVVGPIRQPAYHASKGALLNLMRDLAGAVAG